MNCDDLPEILRRAPREQGCQRVANEKPQACCETNSVSPGVSPGPVKHDEILARFVPAIDYDHESKIIKTSLFAHAGTIGMSVIRISLASERIFTEHRAEAKFIGYVTGKCGEIREIQFDGDRAFAVYDTAKIASTAHADVCQMQFPSKSKASELRRSLQKAFSALLNFDSAN